MIQKSLVRCRRAAVGGLAGLLFFGCIVGSGDERCDENQELKGEVCVCVSGTVPGPNGVGCVECPKHEEPDGQQCVCEDGYVRVGVDGDCVEAPEGLGQACDPNENLCPDDFPLCDNKKGQDPVCTVSCTANSDCKGGYVCMPKGDERLCALPPSGQGEPCTDHSDCEGFDADYCSITEVCVVQNCTASGDTRCQVGELCCDFSMYGAPTICVREVTLDNGACPLGVPEVTEAE